MRVKLTIMDEEWRDIPGFYDYRASSFGRVKSIPHWTPKGTRGGRILKPIPNHCGCGKPGHHHVYVNLFESGEVCRMLIHRIILLTFTGPCPPGMEVRHLNGIPDDNRLVNLVYGTHRENMLDINRYGVHHNTRKTHCPRGHQYDEENTIVKNGSRFCKRCASRDF